MTITSFQKWESKNNPDVSIVTLGLEDSVWRVERRFKNLNPEEDFFRPIDITNKFRYTKDMDSSYVPQIIFTPKETAQEKAAELCIGIEAEERRAYLEKRSKRPMWKKIWDWLRKK